MNDEHTAMRRWLGIATGRRKPASAHALQLLVRGDAEPVAAWTVDDVANTRTDALAGEVADAADGACDGNAQTRLVLRWVDAHGVSLLATTWIVARDENDGSLAAERAAHAKQTENLHRAHMHGVGVTYQALQAVIDSQAKVIANLTEHCANLSAEVTLARAEVDKLREKQPNAPEARGTVVDEVVKQLLADGTITRMLTAPATDAAKGG